MHAHAAVILRNAWKVNEGEQTQPRMCRAMQTHSHAAVIVVDVPSYATVGTPDPCARHGYRSVTFQSSVMSPTSTAPWP